MNYSLHSLVVRELRLPRPGTGAADRRLSRGELGVWKLSAERSSSSMYAESSKPPWHVFIAVSRLARTSEQNSSWHCTRNLTGSSDLCGSALVASQGRLESFWMVQNRLLRLPKPPPVTRFTFHIAIPCNY